MSERCPCGFLLVDKPAGITSFRVVARLGDALGMRKAGHAGTLDPFATGLLPVALGPATRLLEYVINGDKQYLVAVRLGSTTDTLDTEGEVTQRAAVPRLERAAIEQTLARFIGCIEQVPPRYCALKVDGVPLYKLARQGRAPEPGPRRVHVHAIELLGLEPELLRLRVNCGKGTYIRSLARDIAVALGTLGYVEQLRRSVVAPFSLDQAAPLDELEAEILAGRLESRLLSPTAALPPDWPVLRPSAQIARRLTAGDRLNVEQTAELIGVEPAARRFVLSGPQGELLAVLAAFEDQNAGGWRLGPIKVLQPSADCFTSPSAPC